MIIIILLLLFAVCYLLYQYYEIKESMINTNDLNELNNLAIAIDSNGLVKAINLKSINDIKCNNAHANLVTDSITTNEQLQIMSDGRIDIQNKDGVTFEGNASNDRATVEVEGDMQINLLDISTPISIGDHWKLVNDFGQYTLFYDNKQLNIGVRTNGIPFKIYPMAGAQALRGDLRDW